MRREPPGSNIYVVHLTIKTAKPLSAKMIETTASVGGCGAATEGERRLETILSVKARSPSVALDRARKRIRVRGSIIAVGVMTEAEADRRLAEPTK